MCKNKVKVWIYTKSRFRLSPLFTLHSSLFSPRPTLLAERDWYEVDVISCAAPNLREKPSNRMNAHDGNRRIAISPDDLRRLHERRLARILDVASANGAEAVVLGAFGCGAFRNDPTVVASAAAAVIPGYRTLFRTIEFAVYCRPGDSSNYTAFRNTMSRQEDGVIVCPISCLKP